MILGEFNTDTNSFGTDNFDYLFKRKPKAERQAAKAIKKPKQAARRTARQIKRSGGVPPAKTRLIRGNFGLSNRNKTRIPAPAKPIPSAVSEPEVTDENTQDTSNTPEVQPDVAANSGADTETPANEAMPESPDASENPEPVSPESEYSYDEPEKKENPKPKTSGAGAAFGWVFLGVTLGVIAYVLGASSKNPDKGLHEFRRR